MEYGDAINSQSFDRAMALALELSEQQPDRPIAELAADAVAHAYCACVTDGEDAAERRLSDVHRSLIEQVMSRLRERLGVTGSHLRVAIYGERVSA